MQNTKVWSKYLKYFQERSFKDLLSCNSLSMHFDVNKNIRGLQNLKMFLLSMEKLGIEGRPDTKNSCYLSN